MAPTIRGEEVAEEVDEADTALDALEEGGGSPVSTRFVLTSSGRCKSRYTLKLDDFHHLSA